MKQQCLGITKSGERCKITGNLIDGYCYRHRPKTGEPRKERVTAKSAAPDPTPPPPPAATTEPCESDTSGILLFAGIAALILLLILITTGGKRKTELIRLR
ncbi:MAG: hypothetical protein JW863_10705 [Chitinispirillaceae bacterium]|nr:hypothetical protein [Chitinispirillaceae bacterium]